MSFHLATTPTLQAVATGNEHQLVEDLQQRVDAGVAQAEAEPDVIAAAAAQLAAEQHLAKLSRAERALNQFAKDMHEKLASARQAALDAMIETAAVGKPDVKALNEIAALDQRGRHASRAIERLVEQLIPLAEVARLREESHCTMTKARALERIAQDRAEKVLGQLRDAVSEEIVLPVDMSKGVAGGLLAYATQFRNRAVQLSENADQMERKRR
jgi:hypothetical protein